MVEDETPAESHPWSGVADVVENETTPEAPPIEPDSWGVAPDRVVNEATPEAPPESDPWGGVADVVENDAAGEAPDFDESDAGAALRNAAAAALWEETTEDAVTPPPGGAAEVPAEGTNWGEGGWLASNFPEVDAGEEFEPELPDALPVSPFDVEAAASSESERPTLLGQEGEPSEPSVWVAADGGDERDLIVQAFEAHAATEQDESEGQRWDVSEPEPGPALRELLGEEGEQLIADGGDSASIDESHGLLVPGWDRQRTIAGAGVALPPLSPEVASGDGAPPWETNAPTIGAEDARPRHRRRTMVRELVETGLLALLVFLSVRAGLQNFRVEGLSMFPTLEDGQYIIVNKLVYSEIDLDKLNDFVPFIEADPGEKRHVFHGPERGDIVVFASPTRADEDLIKRVIGLPGDTVEILNGRVFINDFLLEEPYIKQDWSDTRSKILIPEGHYYVMGDNRNNSQDSRSAQVGLVPEDLVVGKAMLTYWPMSSFGLAPNGGGNVSEEFGRPVVTTMAIGEFTEEPILTP